MATSGSPNGITARWESLNSRQKKTVILSGTVFIVWFVLLFNPWTSPPPGFTEFVEGLSDSKSATLGIGRSVTAAARDHGGPKAALGAVLAAVALPLMWRIDFWIWLVSTVGLVLYHHDWPVRPRMAVAARPPSAGMGLVVIVTKRAAEVGRVFEYWEAPIEKLREGQDVVLEGFTFSVDLQATHRFRQMLRNPALSPEQRDHLGPALKWEPDRVFFYVVKSHQADVDQPTASKP